MAVTASKRKPYTIHEKDVVLNRNVLNQLLESQGMENITLYNKVCDAYGIDMSYKGFMSLLSNRTSWKLIYAWAIADVLNVDISLIFSTVKVDVQAKVEEKEEWNRNYGKNKGN